MRLSTRLTAAMAGLALVTATAVGLLAYRAVEQEILPSQLDRAETHARFLALELDHYVRNARADMGALRSVPPLDGFFRARLAGGVDPSDGTTEARWLERLAAIFAGQLQAKPWYVRLRFIGRADGGRELLRAERSEPDGAVRLVPAAELQQTADRESFRAAIGLAPGAFYVSPIELNREQGGIGTPPVPVLRIATSVHGADDRPFGIVIVNVDMRPAFAQLRAAARPEQRVYLVNERGDYLVHPDPSREFGFELGTPFRWQAEFPELAAAFGSADGGVRVVRNAAGERIGAALASEQLAEGPRVAVIQTEPYSELAAPAVAAGRAILVVGILAVLCAIALAVVLARSLSRPLVQMTAAVEGFSAGEAIAVPVEASGEIGVLAGAFARMAEEVRQKTAALRRNAEIFDSIMSSMVEGVFLVDEKVEVRFANRAAKAVHADHADSGLRDWVEAYELYRDDGVTPLAVGEWPVVRAVRGERIENLELVLCARGQERRVRLVISARPILDAAGVPRGAVVVFRDVTQAEETERELRQSQKMDAIGQLTGGVAHDFNNLLTVITGTIEILADAVADRPDLAAIANMIDEAATRGADLTQQLLAFARRQPLQPRATDINGLLIDAAKLLRPALGEQVEIESMLQADAWQAMIDPSQLSTAIINLAVNARDAMPDGGKLTLETGNVTLDEAYAQSNPDVEPGAYVMIAVSDSGTGIPAAIRDKVFEPFFTTKTVRKGTGLGLSMVYGFVKQSGGHIKIYSEEGHGTTIRLYLPRSGDEALGTAEHAPAPVPGGNETILVVEDDELVRNYAVAQLRSLGYATLSAASGAEALALVNEGGEFDLLFTDVIMPGMNGRQLADELNRRRPGLRVLYTSGYTQDAIVHQGRLDPGVALLAKPYRQVDLAQKLREVLEQAPRAA